MTLDETHTFATPYGNWYSVVTGEQQLRRTTFLQCVVIGFQTSFFHFSH